MMKDVLKTLAQGGYAPRTMLDIGAHIGTFTQEFLGVFPGCVPTLVEPNPFCHADLSKLGFEQHGVAASKEAGIAEMFLSREWLQSTGASLYRENTAFFRDEVVIKKEVPKARLDDLFAGRRFDFVKIDTQGSELDVILGGPAVLSQADYILVEVSLVEYNLGGARAEELFATLGQLGFHCTEVTDFHRLAGVHDGNLLQMDFLFARRVARCENGELDRLLALAQSLHRESRNADALLLLNHLDSVRPGHLETLTLRIKLLGLAGEPLKALQALVALKACSADVEELLSEIRDQIPASLDRFNTHLAAGEIVQAEQYAAALAGLLPGNVAALNSAMSCNLALGRQQNARVYAAALEAIQTQQNAAPVPSNDSHAPVKKPKRAKKRA